MTVLLEAEVTGSISRPRLLDACLAALALDFKEFRAGWFSRFFERLKPTPAERIERRDRFVALLSSRIPPTVSFAVANLVAIQEAGGTLPRDPLIAIEPALRAKAKKSVLAALAIAKRVLADDPSSHADVRSIATALEHPDRDVQQAALGLLERYVDRADRDLQDRLQAVSAGIAPTVRTRFTALLTQPPAAPLRTRADADEWKPRLRDGNVAAIADADELLESFTAVLETEVGPMELERVLDGVARIGTQRPANFDRLAGPLRKRLSTAEKSRHFSTSNVTRSFTHLAFAWLDGRSVAVHPVRADRYEAFLYARVAEVAKRAVERESFAPLAMPTHADGTIEPAIFVERVARRASVGRFDLIAALLRLRVDGRERALRAAAALPGSIGELVRYTLGGGGDVRSADAALQRAASDARHTSFDDPAVSRVTWKTQEWVVDGRTYRFHRPSLEMPDFDSDAGDDMPTETVHAPPKHEVDRPNAVAITWTETIWPANREAWFARGIASVGNNLDWSEARWYNRRYLEPLMYGDVSLGSNALALMSLGLLAKDAAEGATSVDAAIAAIAEGRLEDLKLRKLAEHLVDWSPYSVTKRAIPRLQAIAAASERHARAMTNALESALGRDSTTPLSKLRPLRIVLEELRAAQAS